MEVEEKVLRNGGGKTESDVCPSPILHKPQSSLSPLYDSSSNSKTLAMVKVTPRLTSFS